MRAALHPARPTRHHRPMLAAAVRTQVLATDAGDRLAAGWHRRTQRLRAAPEEGAQAAEYAMLGGVGAAAATGLILAFRSTDLWKRLVLLIISFIERVITSFL
jgi:hypothetical protein